MNEFRLPSPHIVVDERCSPADAEEARIQPFLYSDDLPLDGLEPDHWSIWMSRETLALALSQATAAHVLPPLMEVPTGEDMLRYRVEFRNQLHPILVRELALVLESDWQALGWEQVSRQRYLCVIGAGVAASLETTPGAERLDLRYASDLETELFHAGYAPDRLRSRLFLQSALYEKMNLLLARVRNNVWHWL